jgi:hypothetical protein
LLADREKPGSTIVRIPTSNRRQREILPRSPVLYGKKTKTPLWLWFLSAI